jgi:hypothetical protein
MNARNNKPILQMKFIQQHKMELAGAIAGAIGGYLYYYFEGCNGGTCPITSKPWNSTLYGALMGILLFSMFKQRTSKTL